MQLNFVGDISEIIQGIEILSEDLGFTLGGDGIRVLVINQMGNILVARENGLISICFERKAHFYRALCILLDQIKSNDEFRIEQIPQFKTVSAMFEVTSGGVLKVQSLLSIIRKIALMGFNTLIINCADTFTIEKYPYFGYMRGRYNYDELKECDDYAYIFGIEMFPCIQTLGHLSEVLKWDYALPLRDTNDVLLVGSEQTYTFIEEMIKAISAPFRSKRIHIGMDEAFDLGRGKYLDIYGLKDKFEILIEHLNRTIQICDKHELHPMIWSDMLFKYFSEKGDYYDLESNIPQDMINRIPAQVQLVYWNYHHTKENDYEIMLKKHQHCRNDVIFAGGVCTWHGLATNYGLSFITINAALHACKEVGIKEIIATVWGDNGTESNYMSSLLGLQLFAEHSYQQNIDILELKKRFEICTNASFDAFMDLKYFDVVPGVNPLISGSYCNPHRYLLWQDILIGLFDKNIEGMQLKEHYEELAQKMEHYKNENEEWSYFFDVMYKLAKVLSIKSEIGIDIKKNYDLKNVDILKGFASKGLPELKENVIELKNAHRVQWFKIYKAMGWEILDIRYGGVIARIDTAIEKLHDYTNGVIDVVEELEQERLPFGEEKTMLCFCNQYRRMISASSL